MMETVNDHEKAQIRQWGRGLDGDITLRYATNGHSMDEPFKAFAHQVAELAPAVRLKKDGDAVVDRPTLFIGSHVAYQALPLDRELEPFLTFLGHGGEFADRIATDVRAATGSAAGAGAGQGVHYTPLPLLSRHRIHPAGPCRLQRPGPGDGGRRGIVS
jgi:hypothetical protein